MRHFLGIFKHCEVLRYFKTATQYFLESCKTVADVVTNAFFLLVDPGLLYLRLEIKK